MLKTEPQFQRYLDHYKRIRVNLEQKDYASLNEFYEDNEITSDEYYMDILRAGITRPRVFL